MQITFYLRSRNELDQYQDASTINKQKTFQEWLVKNSSTAAYLHNTYLKYGGSEKMHHMIDIIKWYLMKLVVHICCVCERNVITFLIIIMLTCLSHVWKIRKNERKTSIQSYVLCVREKLSSQNEGGHRRKAKRVSKWISDTG